MESKEKKQWVASLIFCVFFFLTHFLTHERGFRFSPDQISRALKCDSQQTGCVWTHEAAPAVVWMERRAAVYISCHLQLLTAYYSSSQCGYQNTEQPAALCSTSHW